MIDEQQEENIFLDFKLKTDPSSKKMSGDDKSNYAKALSGFSNTSGGVIIWGVDASKNEDNVDAAREIKPISHLKVFLNTLNSLLSGALIPLNPGIKNIPIPLQDEPDKGIVVTYVPESVLPPHRALLKNNQYYTRSGDSFVMMEHVHLEDMFGKRQKPLLYIHTEIQNNVIFGGIQGQKVFHVDIIFGIKNIGRYVAKYPALRIKPTAGLKINNNKTFSMSLLLQSNQTRAKDGYMFTGGANDVIHPNSFFTIGYLETIDPIKESYFINPAAENTLSFSFEYEIFAEGCPSVSGEVNIQIEEIKQAVYNFK